VPDQAGRVAPIIDRSPDAVLRASMRLLVRTPEMSLGDLATAIGIGRTTLHRMFASRGELMAALAHQALDDLETTYRAAGFGPVEALVGAADVAPTGPPQDVLAAVAQLVELLIPLGPSLMFLLRARELDDDTDLIERVRRLDGPLHEALGRAAREGSLDQHVPSRWMAETLFANVWVAWEQIAEGRLAGRDAAALVTRTLLRGVGAPPPTPPAGHQRQPAGPGS
jgi:AcrR family transcriptional regulator